MEKESLSSVSSAEVDMNSNVECSPLMAETASISSTCSCSGKSHGVTKISSSSIQPSVEQHLQPTDPSVDVRGPVEGKSATSEASETVTFTSKEIKSPAEEEKDYQAPVQCDQNSIEPSSPHPVICVPGTFVNEEEKSLLVSCLMLHAPSTYNY